jgi:hypothetical protein
LGKIKVKVDDGAFESGGFWGGRGVKHTLHK